MGRGNTSENDQRTTSGDKQTENDEEGLATLRSTMTPSSAGSSPTFSSSGVAFPQEENDQIIEETMEEMESSSLL